MIDLKRISAALGLLAASALSASAQSPAPSPNQRTADAIAASLRANPELSRSRIAIETREGTVLLVGTVANPALRAEAIRRAGGAPGVVSVVDRLTVVGDGRVRTVQYQPQQMAMGGGGGGVFHRGGMGMGAPTDGGTASGPVMDGGMAAGPATGAPAYDGPLPEGAAGMTSPAVGGQPNYAWPSYAPATNFSAVGYPTAYPWQAFPNIGPFYPYPEVPLDWRAVTLRWDDGIWWLDFRKHYTRPFFTPYPFGLFAY
jgi:BON domain